MPTYRWGTNPTGAYQKVVMPWHRPATLDQHEENVRALERIDWGNGQGTRWRTIVIAAADSTKLSKATADYVCTGAADQTIINTAISTLMNSRSLGQAVGRIVFLEGTYTITSAITFTAFTARSLFLEGMGGGVGIDSQGSTILATRIVNSSSSGNAFFFGGNSAAAGSSVAIENLEVRGSSSSAHIATRDMALIVRQCTLIQGGSGGGIAQTSSTGHSGLTRVENNVITCTGAGAYGIDLGSAPNGEAEGRVTGNHISISGASSRGINVQNNASNQPSYMIIGNSVKSSSASSTYGIIYQGNSTLHGLCANNIIRGPVGTGISLSGYASECVGNYIYDCTVGIDGTPFQMDYALIVANNIASASSIGIRIGNSGVVGSTRCTAIANIIQGAATGIVVGTGSADAGIFVNDTNGCTANMTDAGVRTRTEANLPGLIGSIVPTGGATQTVLKKNSATTGDYGWATDPAIDLATAKGDILVASAVDVLAALTVGKNEALLTPDSAQALGVKWGRRMFVQSTDPSLTITPDLGDVWIDTT